MDYTQIVEEGNIEALKEIYDIIVSRLPYRLISQPETGKVVISHSDPQEKTDTYIGDTLATYCEAEVDGCMGYGAVPGNDPQRAIYAALIDSVIWNQHPVSSLIMPLLEKMRVELHYKWQNRYRELCV